jgi:glycosyltransferase involved in cell wall biosynthesis
VTSPHTAHLLASRYAVAPENITIARPGVDPPAGAAAPADPPLILSVGIAVPRKGHDTLLRALAMIGDRSWEAVIVGEARDGSCAAQLQQLVVELGLGQRVRLAGRIAAGELSRYYRQARIFALATRYEGYGIVFDEAMTHGLPIVSCAVGAVPETVAPGAGRLVPPEDPAAFAAALAGLLDDDAQRSVMADASRRAGAALPRWEETARRVAAVIDGVAARG